MLRRSRFDELVARQLALLAEDEAGLIDEAVAADAAWTNATAEESEELYGDYRLVVEALGDRLHDVRETYAATLDPGVAGEYRRAFDRGARKRFGRHADSLDAEES